MVCFRYINANTLQKEENKDDDDGDDDDDDDNNNNNNIWIYYSLEVVSLNQH